MVVTTTKFFDFHSRIQFNGSKWFEHVPSDDSLARKEGDVLVNSSYLSSLGIPIDDSIDYDIERRFRLYTFWDVFVARDGRRVVFFGDRHPEYRMHAIQCVFDGGALNTSAESSTFDNVPATALECDLPDSVGTDGTLVLRSPRDRIESPVFQVAALRERWRATLERRWRVSMWTMLLNQETLIVPWIEYHLMLGVEHFYLYDNGCEDDTLPRVQPYVERGLATVIDWRIGQRYQHWGSFSWLYSQIAAMNHFLVRFGPASEWVGMFDIDEFVYFVNDNQKHSIYVDLLQAIVADDSLCAGVALRCRFFGGQRRLTLPEDFLPRYMHLGEADVEEHGYEKVFVRPARLQWRVNIHSLVRERLCVADAHKLAHMQHYWWNRPRRNATVRDDSLWRRYGARLLERVPPSAILRSNATKEQWFSM